MVPPPLADDFKEFLRLCESHAIEYLVIGGYALGVYGHIRTTLDMDVWVAATPENAARVCAALIAFGLAPESVSPALFLDERNVVRLGVPPLRLEILTSISGVTFAECHPERTRADFDGQPAWVIGLEHLKRNKAASGRPKDLDDLRNLDAAD